MIPIFISGCDRSGTTLLGSIIGSANNAIAVPESQFLINLYRLSLNGMLCPNKASSFLSSNKRFLIWNSSIPSFEGVKKIKTGEFIERLVENYSIQKKENLKFWVDHSPGHICYLMRLCEIFPEARFIHMVRDGRAVAASILSLPDWPFGTVYGVAQHWIKRVGIGVAAECSLKDKILRVHYENLLKNPKIVLQKICNFIGLDYEERMLKGNGFKVPEYTKQQHQLVGKGIFIKRIDAWKKELSVNDIRVFESVCGDMLPYLGYELCFPHSNKVVKRLSAISAMLVDAIYAVRSNIKRNRRFKNSYVEH